MNCIFDILFHKEPLNKKKLSVNDDKDLHRFITDGTFLRTFDFIWKVVAITSVSCIPLYILKYLRKKFSPPVYAKLTWWTSQFSFFLTDSLSYRYVYGTLWGNHQTKVNTCLHVKYLCIVCVFWAYWISHL